MIDLTSPENIDLREKIVHIDLMIAETQRKLQEAKHAPWVVVSTIAAGAGGFFAAGVAVVKLLGH